MNVVRHAQLQARVPPRAVEDEDDLLRWASADLARERLELDLEERNGDTRREVKDGASRGRMDKADEIAPVIAVLDRRRGAVTVEAPDLLEDRLQADTVLIDRPELDARLRVGGRDRLDDRPQLFLKAVCCSGSASTWRGRGLSRLPSSRTK